MAISTLAGHSLLHALQLRQSSNASFKSSEANPSGSFPSKTCRNTFARPRVESFSSFVAMYEGHIVPPDWAIFRQTPAPLQLSITPVIPPSLRQANTVSGSGSTYSGENLRSLSIGSGSTILPGLNTLNLSQMCFTSLRTGIISLPSTCSIKGARARPSPCSPDNEPPNLCTKSAISEAISFMVSIPSSVVVSIIGRKCNSPTLA